MQRKELNGMKHDYYTSKDISPDDEWGQRNIVDGGLAICKVCGGGEGSLTTDCPGEKIPYEKIRKYIRVKLILLMVNG
jgi:hypothetical protein